MPLCQLIIFINLQQCSFTVKIFCAISEFDQFLFFLNITMTEIPPNTNAKSTNGCTEKPVLYELEIEPKLTAKGECKICMEGINNADQILVHPCACAGSLQYVHDTCLTSWITKQYEQSELRQQLKNDDRPICQICKQPYACQVKVQSEWATCQTIQEKMKKNILVTFATIGFTLINILLLIVSSHYAYVDRMKPSYDISNPRFFMVYFSIFLSAASLLYGIEEFIVNFLRIQNLKLIFPRQAYANIQKESPPIQGQQKNPNLPQMFQESQNGLTILK